MADGPSVEDSSSFSFSSSSSSSSSSLSSSCYTIELLKDCSASGSSSSINNNSGRVPRERHKRQINNQLDTNSASATTTTAASATTMFNNHNVNGNNNRKRHSSSEDTARRNSNERRGTRQHSAGYELKVNNLETTIDDTTTLTAAINNSTNHHNNYNNNNNNNHNHNNNNNSSSNNLKIASAVVLVERSEITIIDNRKKIKVSNNNINNNYNNGVNIASSKKDSKKDKDHNKDKVGGSVVVDNSVISDEVIIMDDHDDLIVLQDNQPQQQQKKRKVTRASTAAAAEKNNLIIKNNNKSHNSNKSNTEDNNGNLNVGPCAKKRCADRYDSSESSDSGVAVSCGDCTSNSSSSSLSSIGSASSGCSTSGSDITEEPGSPFSSSSSCDEGLGGVQQQQTTATTTRNNNTINDTKENPKLAPTQQAPTATRPQWPWTPPLATTACTNTYKRFKAEPEHGSLPNKQTGHTDPGTRHSKANSTTTAANNKVQQQQQQQDSQGKITEYFKTQIKPQQPKTKKNQSNDVSVMVAKNTVTEFRRPATVQRNGKNGLAKYHLGTNVSSRNTSAADWEVRTLSQGVNGLQSRLKHNSTINDKKSSATTTTMTNIISNNNSSSNSATNTTTNGINKNSVLPVLPIPSEVLSTLPSCKISNLRLTSEARPSESPPPTLATPTALVTEQTNQFKDIVHSPKPILVSDSNLTNTSCDKSTDIFSRFSLPSTPSDSVKDDDEEESSRDSAESSKRSTASLSPILSAPTTIRFPVKAPGKGRGQSTDSGFCRWNKCGLHYETSSILLEHLQAAHISTQTGGDNFVCHWQGCKVEGRTSCSRRWLERHVLSHGGNKPFQCIVDGCGNRFSSQTALERHVNGHFNQSETSSTSSRKSTDSGGKLVRRNGKKLRYRRQPWSARIFDYFDPGVMENLQHRLLELAQTRTQGRLAETPGDSLALTSQVLAKRVELDGKTRVLLRWHPQDIEPDQWVLESEVQTTKHVAIRTIAASKSDEVHSALYPAVNNGQPPLQRVKQRRKPVKTT